MLSPDWQLTRVRNPLGCFTAGLRWAPWLTAGWIAKVAGLLLIINLCLAAGAVIITQQSVPGERPISIDFVSFYAAGSLANAGVPALAYDQAAHQRAEEAATTAGGNYQLFFYPPIYLFLCQSLAALPYLPSFIVFEALTLSVFLLVMRRVAGPEGRLAWLLLVLAFSPVFWNILEGQNGFLTASLLGAGTLLADRRPFIAGMLLGAVCYKPHFGLLVPVALMAGGRWRSIAGATGVACGLAGLSWLAYGTVTWRAYLDLFLASGHEYGSGRISFSGMVSAFGAARLVGLPVAASLGLQGLASLAATAAVAWIWRRSDSQAVRGAALASGTMVAVPMALLYDQMVTLVALAWLVRAARLQGFLRWEKLVLAAAFTLAVASFPLGITLGLPLAPMPAAMLLALCAVRTSCRSPFADAGRHSLGMRRRRRSGSMMALTNSTAAPPTARSAELVGSGTAVECSRPVSGILSGMCGATTDSAPGKGASVSGGIIHGARGIQTKPGGAAVAFSGPANQAVGTLGLKAIKFVRRSGVASDVSSCA